MPEVTPRLTEIHTEPFDWDVLITYIQDRKVVPVVGSELLMVEHEGSEVPLDHLMGKRFFQELDMSGAEFPDFKLEPTLGNVVSYYLLHARARDARRRAYIAINQIWKNLAPELETPKLLLDLVSIRDCNFLVSTTGDGLLARAVDEDRFGGKPKTKRLAYSLRRQMADIDLEPDSDPLVFQLFGEISAFEDDYVVTDDDLLEFVHSLQAGTKIAPNMLQLLRERDLLLIGCNFADWLVRFFWRILSQDRASRDHLHAGFIADQRAPTDHELIFFLRNTRVQVFPTPSAAHFVRELFSRWKNADQTRQQRGFRPDPPPIPDEPIRKDVFLSYARVDQHKVGRLKDALERIGIRVWYDRIDIRPGQNFPERIKTGIRDCKVFVPCLSKAALSARRGFFRAEWSYAAEESRFRADRFLYPVFLDAEQPRTNDIPPAFRDVHIPNCADADSQNEFVNCVKDALHGSDDSREHPSHGR